MDQYGEQGSAKVPPGFLTHKEIFHQPELWLTTAERVSRANGTLKNSNQPVIITGAGTSAYAAIAIAEHWPGATAVPTTDLLVTSEEEIESNCPEFRNNGFLLSLARSGDSPESIAVVRRLQRLFPAVKHFAITCNSEGKLARLDGVECILLDPRTNDRSLAMTSSFSNLVLAGLCLRHGMDWTPGLSGICRRVQKNLPFLDAEAKKLAQRSVQRAVILAGAAQRALSEEASLKILEMTAGRIATLAETFLGLRHGPMSFLRKDSVVLCFLSSSLTRRRYEEDLLKELRQKQLGYIVSVAPDTIEQDLCDVRIPANAPDLPDFLRTPFEIPFAQLLAYHLSLQSGLNPDRPSPTGAISRVVQPFRIYEEDLYV